MASIPYAAFLRGINVGGTRKVPMAELRTLLEKSGFADVRTYIQSGNVLFSSSEKDVDVLGSMIARAIKKKFGFDVPTCVRTVAELRTLERKHPFGRTHDPKRTYVIFLHADPVRRVKLPLKDARGYVELVSLNGRNAFARPLTDVPGKADPNGFAEKTFGVPSTTRNMNTLRAMLE